MLERQAAHRASVFPEHQEADIPNPHPAGCARSFRSAESASDAPAPSASRYLRTIRNHQPKERPEALFWLVVPQGLEPWTR